MMDIFKKHQLSIARKTLRLSDAGAFILGGMSKDEARAIIKKHRIRNMKKGGK